MVDNELEKLLPRIVSERDSVWKWAGRWSFLYHFSIYGAATLSGFVAFLIEAEPSWFDDNLSHIASLLAAIAALMTTISGLGGFQRKWRTCRVTNKALSDLEIDAMASDVIPSEIRKRYKSIWSDHELGILGAK